MFNLEKVYGSTDVSVPIYVIDSSDGTPETGYAHDTAGIDLWYRREGGAEVSITEAALAAWNSAHTDGGVEHGSDGRGRLDLPDAACALGTDGATYVEYGGTITGMIVVGGVVQLRHEQGVQGQFSGTHSTTSADLGANAPANSIIGMSLYFPTVKQSRVVETYNTGTGVAGWTTALSAAPQDDEPWVLFPTPPIDAVTISAIQSGLATSAAQTTAQADLDTLTGTDGVTLATSQPNYAPATAASLATAQADLDTLTGTDGATLATSQPNYAPATAAGQTTIDSNVDAIKAKTDSLTFTGTSVQADIQAVDGAAISQGGSDPASPYGVT